MYSYSIRRVLVLAVTILLLALASTLQAGNVERDTIDIPVTSWIGEEFVVLPPFPPAVKNDGGYEDLRLSPSQWDDEANYDPWITHENGNPKVEVLMGKKLVVTNVKALGDDDFLVTFRCKDLDVDLYSTAYSGTISEIGFVKDLGRAQRRWLGKTIYSAGGYITTFDPITSTFESIDLDKRIPLQVTSVVVGDGYRPIQVNVQTPGGRTGYIGVHYSRTNCSHQFMYDRPWQQSILEYDPVLRFNWSNRVWNLINSRDVQLGMTSQQVELSIYAPTTIIRSGPDSKDYAWEWNFVKVASSLRRLRITFVNDTVVSIEDI